MDKRIIKTEQAIYDGFCEVLSSKDYNEITIDNILKASFELYRNIMVPSTPDNNSAVFISTLSESTASI